MSVLAQLGPPSAPSTFSHPVYLHPSLRPRSITQVFSWSRRRCPPVAASVLAVSPRVPTSHPSVHCTPSPAALKPRVSDTASFKQNESTKHAPRPFPSRTHRHHLYPSLWNLCFGYQTSQLQSAVFFAQLSYILALSRPVVRPPEPTSRLNQYSPFQA
ncbi:hypothetical protein K504DRAFT_8376 [Pleomassaria siparia CBS 279.74]|uniref:Uncharacterized protein n=1 Tax=Pleomassaria siparia CBS 279.74 TaxID=1314801 RepID=A0A6G1KQ67_9PLEO|nr:hypothetical protein K504DRAFT_8376 [Pleomassaria siparia CBS 279.74]